MMFPCAIPVALFFSKLTGNGCYCCTSLPCAQGLPCERTWCTSTAKFPIGEVSWPYMSAQIFVWLHVNMHKHSCVSLSSGTLILRACAGQGQGTLPWCVLEPQNVASCTCRRTPFTAEWCSLQCCREVSRELKHSLLHPSFLALCSGRKADKCCWPLQAVIPESIPSGAVLLLTRMGHSLLKPGPMQDGILQLSNLVLREGLRASYKYVLNWRHHVHVLPWDVEEFLWRSQQLWVKLLGFSSPGFLYPPQKKLSLRA